MTIPRYTNNAMPLEMLLKADEVQSRVNFSPTVRDNEVSDNKLSAVEHLVGSGT